MNKTTDAQRKVLGKGLSALLPQRHSAAAQTSPKVDVAEPPSPSPREPEKSLTRLVSISKIHPNPNQPRQDFDESRISELAQSIRANGVIQPITVCEAPDGTFMIVAGERRWRAASLAGLNEIPIYVRTVDPGQILELALIENIQREDLNPIETAQAFDQLIGHYHLTHEQIAERTGKDRSTITNFVRLLRLTPEVRQHLAANHIAMGHARALLSLDQPAAQISMCQQVIEKDLSVRETERLVKQFLSAPLAEAQAQAKPERKVDANTRAALDEMAMALGTKVKIIPRSAHSGRLEIQYYSNDDLQRIYEVIVPEK